MTLHRRSPRQVGGSPLLALIVGTDSLSQRPSTARLVDALSRAAEVHEAGLVMILGSDRPSEAVRNFATQGLISGVVLRAPAAEFRWVRELRASVPAVMIGAHRELQDVHVIDTESVESTASLVGSMIDAGCVRLAMVGGPADRLDASDRLEGFRLAHSVRGLAFDPSLVFQGDYLRTSGHRVAGALLDAGADGVFAANDEMARGVIERAEQRGLGVPTDLMVAGFDGDDAPATDALDLATVRQPWDGLAQTAIETLLGVAAGMDMPRIRIIDPEITLGQTIVTRRDDQGVGSEAASESSSEVIDLRNAAREGRA